MAHVLREVEALLVACRSTLPNALPDTLPGILWAVSSDPRESVRAIEKWLVDERHGLSYHLLLGQFQGGVHRVKNCGKWRRILNFVA